MEKLLNKQKKHLPPLLQVIINSPDTIEWEGFAEAISSENSEGPFDILPAHTNFITIIENKPIIVRSKGRDQTFSYQTAVIAVQNNKVTIYAGI